MNVNKIGRARSLGLAVVLTLGSLVAVSAPAAPAGAASGNLLTNGDMEAGTTGWSVFGAGTLASNTSVVHGGTRSLSYTGRTASYNGPSQNATSLLTNGASFTTSVWMRAQSGAPTGKVTLQVIANGTTSYITLGAGRGEHLWVDAADGDHDRVLEWDAVIGTALRGDGFRYRQLLRRRRLVR